MRQARLDYPAKRGGDSLLGYWRTRYTSDLGELAHAAEEAIISIYAQVNGAENRNTCDIEFQSTILFDISSYHHIPHSPRVVSTCIYACAYIYNNKRRTRAVRYLPPLPVFRKVYIYKTARYRTWGCIECPYALLLLLLLPFALVSRLIKQLTI